MAKPPSLEDLDSSAKEQLQLKTFESKFDVKDFVGALSERLISQSKAEPGPFNPVPFIRTFEAAVDKLIELRKDVQARSEQLEKSVKIAEREYSRKMSDLNKGFDAVSESFSGMESKMSEVGRTAIRIGEQLESVHLQRQRAEAAHDLIDYYIQFTRADTSRLDVLRKQSGKEGRRQLATILRRLSAVAKEVDLPTAEQTKESIDRYCEKFEKDMLNLFDRCYRKEDPKMMHHCAQTLQDFNGGTSCVQIYVNQHDFFINRVRQRSRLEEDAVLWKALPDPDSPPPRSEKGLAELFREIRTTVGEEAQIVQVVFPNPPLVMQVFLQRVFAQSIQQQMEHLINTASALSTLAFLRILQLVHVETAKLVDDLREYELTSAAPRSPADTSVGLSASASTSSVGGAAGPPSAAVSLGTMLETAVEELFVPFTDGPRYLEKETKNLGELYVGYLGRFTRYHENAIKAKGSVFDRMVNQFSAASSSASSATAALSTSTTAAALMKLGGFSSSSAAGSSDREEKTRSGSTPAGSAAATGAGIANAAGVDVVIKEEDGILTLKAAETMLKWHAESVGRCVELSTQGDIPKHAFALSRVLAEAIVTSYTEVALETASARLEAADPKSELTLTALSVLRQVDLICHLWQQYVSTALLPLASASVTVRREMMVYNNQTISRIEGAANALLQRLTDTIVAWLSLQLSKQKKNDFKPRDDDLSFARVNTEPCEACCDMLEKVRDAARENLSGKNLENFLLEIGVSFHTLLLEHLRKFPVNATGGLMLAKDLKSYQDMVSTFNVPSLNERFEFIRQLGNVFLVRPEILKSYITEGYLGRIDAALLRPYLAQRSDWGQAEKGFDGVIMNGDEPGTAESKGLKDRLGVSRLSTMMKEIEGICLGDGMGSGFSLRAFGN